MLFNTGVVAQLVASDRDQSNMQPPRLTRAKSYVCKYCKERFDTGQALGGHMNKHRKEREDDKYQRALQLLGKCPRGGNVMTTRSSQQATGSALPQAQVARLVPQLAPIHRNEAQHLLHAGTSNVLYRPLASNAGLAGFQNFADQAGGVLLGYEALEIRYAAPANNPLPTSHSRAAPGVIQQPLDSEATVHGMQPDQNVDADSGADNFSQQPQMLDLNAPPVQEPEEQEVNNSGADSGTAPPGD